MAYPFLSRLADHGVTEMKLGRWIGIGALTIALWCSTGCAGKEDPAEDPDLDAPTSGLVLTEEEAAALSGKMRVKLYYKTQEGKRLSSEIRLVEYTAKDGKVEHLLEKMLLSLLEGPTEGGKLGALIPAGTKLESVRVQGDCAILDFNRAFADGLPEEKETAELLAYSLVNTVTELKEIQRVQITVEGSEIGQTSSGVEFGVFTRNVGVVATSTEVEDVFLESDYDDVELE